MDIVSPLSNIFVFFSKYILILSCSDTWKSFEKTFPCLRLYLPHWLTSLFPSHTQYFCFHGQILCKFWQRFPLFKAVAVPLVNMFVSLLNPDVILENKHLPQKTYLGWIIFQFVFLLYHFISLKHYWEQASTRANLHTEISKKLYQLLTNLNAILYFMQ